MNKNYCFTDIHGKYDLWYQIKNYCDENDNIFFLGDAIDRGEYGITIMNELLMDKRVTYLKGNHEDMLSICVPEFIEGHFESYPWWVYNGGKPTWESLQRCSDDSKMWYVRKINSMPESLIYTNTKGQKIFLSHAGTSINKSKRELQLMSRGDNPYLWDRKHFLYPWPQDKEFENWFVVHGHTPVQILTKELNIKLKGVCEYNNGHKFDLDLASSDTNIVALFDLDELKVEKYFIGEQ